MNVYGFFSLISLKADQKIRQAFSSRASNFTILAVYMHRRDL